MNLQQRTVSHNKKLSKGGNILASLSFHKLTQNWCHHQNQNTECGKKSMRYSSILVNWIRPKGAHLWFWMRNLGPRPACDSNRVWSERKCASMRPGAPNSLQFLKGMRLCLGGSSQFSKQGNIRFKFASCRPARGALRHLHRQWGVDKWHDICEPHAGSLTYSAGVRASPQCHSTFPSTTI